MQRKGLGGGGGGGEGGWKLELVGTQAVYARSCSYLSLFPVVNGLCGPGQINESHHSLQNFQIFSLKLQILFSKGLARLILTFILSWFIMVIELSGVQFGRKSDAWFEITSIISDQNCTTQSSITTLLHLFWNHRVSLSILIFYFC